MSVAVNKPVGDNRMERRGEEAIAGEDQAGRRDGMDQAQQEVRRIHGWKKAGEERQVLKKIQGRAGREEGQEKRKTRAGGRR
jgi:hypothetical protein